MEEISEIIRTDSYERGYEKASEFITEYPNCDKLVLFLAQVLDAYLLIQKIENREKYEDQIIGWLELVATGKDPALSSRATASLCQLYMKKKEYQKAQQLLDQIPPIGYDKRMMQGILYANLNEMEKAYEVFETMLYQTVNEVSSILQSMITFLCKEKKYKEADQYAKLASQTAELFDLGSYMASTPRMIVALDQKDQQASLDYLEHMKQKKVGDTGGVKEIKNMLKNAFESDQEYEFLREDARFKRIMHKLEGRWKKLDMTVQIIKHDT